MEFQQAPRLLRFLAAPLSELLQSSSPTICGHHVPRCRAIPGFLSMDSSPLLRGRPEPGWQWMSGRDGHGRGAKGVRTIPKARQGLPAGDFMSLGAFPPCGICVPVWEYPWDEPHPTADEPQPQLCFPKSFGTFQRLSKGILWGMESMPPLPSSPASMEGCSSSQPPFPGESSPPSPGNPEGLGVAQSPPLSKGLSSPFTPKAGASPWKLFQPHRAFSGGSSAGNHFNVSIFNRKTEIPESSAQFMAQPHPSFLIPGHGPLLLEFRAIHDGKMAGAGFPKTPSHWQ